MDEEKKRNLRKAYHWFMFVGWLALALFALLTNEEAHWKEMWIFSCFLLAFPHAFKE